MPTPSFTDIIKAYLEAQFGGDVPPIPGVTIDSELSTTSENPVQNKVITAALALKAAITDIPTKLSQLLNDSGYQTAAQVQSAIGAAVPTKTSDLTNDSGFQTAAQVQAVVDTAIGNTPDWPLLKSYTAATAVSDRLDIMLDRPAKRMRVKIAGVANSDVSANITPTIFAFCADPSTTSFAPHNLKKIAYRPIVSASPATLLCDWRNDSQMQLSVAQSFFGAVSLTSNGWLNVADATLVPSVGSYVAHGIRIDKSGSVVATTGMSIEIYGLEA